MFLNRCHLDCRGGSGRHPEGRQASETCPAGLLAGQARTLQAAPGIYLCGSHPPQSHGQGKNNFVDMICDKMVCKGVELFISASQLRAYARFCMLALTFKFVYQVNKKSLRKDLGLV